jgi:Transglutaminase-like superfamily
MRGCHGARGAAVPPEPLVLRWSQLWLAVRVGVWLCLLPLRWRVHSLPELLQGLASTRRGALRRDPLAMEQAVRIVRRVCRLRCFRGPWFPRACLRQALALYDTLTRLGYPASIHFGVYKAGEALHGHSWVTVDGKVVGERMPPEALQPIYAFPAGVSRPARERSRADGRA